jgi:hypothetical protein
MHGFIAPSAEPARIATDVLKRKIEEFYVSAFRAYEDSAREKTATEVRQDVSSGVGAFLQLLKAAIDDAENEAFWRIEQINYPERRELWFTSRVERSDTFLPIDVDSAIETLRKRYFGETAVVPAGKAARISAAKQIAAWDGVVVDEKELEAMVMLGLILEHLGAAENLLTLPPEGVGELLVGILDSVQFKGDADGLVARLVSVLQEEKAAEEDKKALPPSVPPSVPPSTLKQ